MGDDDRGQTQFFVQRLVLVGQIVAGHRIECAKGLVHQHEAGPRRQRAGHADSLLLAATQLVGHAGSDVLRQLDQIEQFGDPRIPARFLSSQFQPDRDIAGDGHMGEQADILEHIADPAAQDMAVDRVDRLVTNPDGAAVRFNQPVDHLEQGGFSRTRQADQRDQRTGGDIQRYRIDGANRTVIAAQLLQADGRTGDRHRMI